MKMSSFSAQKKRAANCQIVRRQGRLHVISPSNPGFHARQGSSAAPNQGHGANANQGRVAHANTAQNTNLPLSNTGRNAHADN